MVVFFALGSIVGEPSRGWLWWVLVPAALAVGLLVALLLNFGIFAPIYWVLGKRKSKKQQTHSEKT
jgi:hypothetical protein